VPTSGDARRAHDAWMADGGSCVDWPLSGAALQGFDVIVDAIFGTGLSRTPPSAVCNAIAAVAAARAVGTGVLAVDVPSGLSSDSGAVLGAAIGADLTVTFIGNKLGLYIGDGPDHAGTVVFAPLDAAPSRLAGLSPHACLLDQSDLQLHLPPRPRNAHKGQHGHVLIIGGDLGMGGAVLMAARAALRAGAGLVTVATRPEHAAAVTAAQPELMVRGIEQPEQLGPLLVRATVVAIGPGLGRGDWGRMLWDAVHGRGPMVVDADGLNLLSEQPSRNEDWILTPHPGEAARLLGVETRDVQTDRITAVCALRARYGGVVVLKGSGSLIAGAIPRLCPYGNPGMSVGGMGDVLTGVVAALRAQGSSNEAAAAIGVLAHAVAGDLAARAGERGMLPSDLLDHLRAVVNPPPAPAQP
jgi:NAD(P)H-hydrate epimerase